MFSAVRDQYMRDGEGFLLVCALTAKSSFDALRGFYQQIHQVKEEDEEVPIVIMGNKVSESQSSTRRKDESDMEKPDGRFRHHGL